MNSKTFAGTTIQAVHYRLKNFIFHANQFESFLGGIHIFGGHGSHRFTAIANETILRKPTLILDVGAESYAGSFVSRHDCTDAGYLARFGDIHAQHFCIRMRTAQDKTDERAARRDVSRILGASSHFVRGIDSGEAHTRYFIVCHLHLIENII